MVLILLLLYKRMTIFAIINEVVRCNKTNCLVFSAMYSNELISQKMIHICCWMNMNIWCDDVYSSSTSSFTSWRRRQWRHLKHCERAASYKLRLLSCTTKTCIGNDNDTQKQMVANCCCCCCLLLKC